MKEVDSSIKYAWAYLIHHGKITDGDWSFYGGCWESKLSYTDQVASLKDIKRKVVDIGINWEKTGVPAVTSENEFTGTFDSHSTQCLATLGKLILLNGEEYLIGSSDDDAAHLAEAARMMIESPGGSEVERLAAKI